MKVIIPQVTMKLEHRAICLPVHQGFLCKDEPLCSRTHMRFFGSSVLCQPRSSFEMIVTETGR